MQNLGEKYHLGKNYHMLLVDFIIEVKLKYKNTCKYIYLSSRKVANVTSDTLNKHHDERFIPSYLQLKCFVRVNYLSEITEKTDSWIG